MKTIKYYRKNVYGNTLEYILDPGDAQIVRQLTKQNTINEKIRELIADLSDKSIVFEEVIAPS